MHLFHFIDRRTSGCMPAVLCACALALAAKSLHAADQPDDLPRLPYHLTARPFAPLGIPRDAYLDVVESVCRHLASLQDDRGAIIDPELGHEHQYATPYFVYPVGVLMSAGRAPELRDAGIRAMEHATRCFAAGHQGIPDRHGEFFIAPLAGALELYRQHVDQDTWGEWQKRLRTPITQVLEDQHGRTNNWRTYAMQGEWLRGQRGLVARDDALAFISDAWLNRTQRERIVADRWNFYQDWSSDPQSHAVEAVGRGNLLALVASGYDGPHRAEIARCARRGTEASLLWQDPSGQCPPNGRTDNHVFNDVLYQLAYEIMSADAQAQGQCEQAGRLRRAALLSFRSIERWRRADQQHAGSYYVTKNHFDPADHVGYQPASQTTNYNGAIAYHLAEAYRARHGTLVEQPAPAEIGGYVVAADPRFASAVANAGGMQIVANLRGDTVPKYGQYWTPLGVVRFARAGWDSRLGPSDGVHDADSGHAATFGPTWRESGRWVRLAERAEHYRGTLVTEFVHPLLVRFHILYHTVTGQGGPTFRHEFIVTPDGVLATLRCSQDIPFGLTIPVVVDDGRPLQVNLAAPILSVTYPRAIEPSGDEQNYLLLGPDAVVTDEPAIRSAVGWLKPLRVVNRDRVVAVFVYPRTAHDPPATDVLTSFRIEPDGFTSCLGSVHGTLYQGRTAAGGHGRSINIDDGFVLTFEHACGFLLQRDPTGPSNLETDRATTARFAGRNYKLDSFIPLDLRGENSE